MIYLDNVRSFLSFKNKKEEPHLSLSQTVAEVAILPPSLSPIPPLVSQRNFEWLQDSIKNKSFRVLPHELFARTIFLRIEDFSFDQKIALANRWKLPYRHYKNEWIAALRLKNEERVSFGVWYFSSTFTPNLSWLINFLQFTPEEIFTFFQRIGKISENSCLWEHIDRFPLTIEERIELGKIGAKFTPLLFAKSIEKFHLPQYALTTFAEELIDHHPSIAGKYYRSFQVADPSLRYLHASLMLGGIDNLQEDSLRYLGNFNLSFAQKQVLIELALLKKPSLIASLLKANLFQREEHQWVDLAEGVLDLEDGFDERFRKTVLEEFSGYDEMVETILSIEVWPEKVAAIQELCSFFLSLPFIKHTPYDLCYVPSIIALKSAQLRPQLLSTWLVFLKETEQEDRSSWVSFSTPFRLAEKYPWASAIRCCLAPLEKNGVEVEIVFEILEKWFRESKDIEKFKILLHLLTLLSRNKNLSPTNISTLFKVLAKDPKHFLFDQLKQLCCLLQTEKSDLLAQLLSNEGILNSAPGSEFFDLFIQSFQCFFDEPISPDLIQAAIGLFANYRVPSVLTTYMTNLASLAEENSDVREGAMKAFGRHIVSLLEGTYRTERYSEARNPHLALIPPQLVQKWSENSVAPIGDGLWIVETDDPEDLLVGPTEIGTCLQISMSPYHNNNFGLLGHLGNGQTRMIAIKKGEKGKICARATLKLLLDEQNRPVLFLDSIFRSELLSDARFSAEIIKKGREKALALGCQLTGRVGLFPDQDEDIFFPLFSRGGAVPYDYCDGCSGSLLKSAEFEVGGASPFNP